MSPDNRGSTVSSNFFHFLENVSKRVKLLKDMPADYVIASCATEEI